MGESYFFLFVFADEKIHFSPICGIIGNISRIDSTSDIYDSEYIT